MFSIFTKISLFGHQRSLTDSLTPISSLEYTSIYYLCVCIACDAYIITEASYKYYVLLQKILKKKNKKKYIKTNSKNKTKKISKNKNINKKIYCKFACNLSVKIINLMLSVSATTKKIVRNNKL